MKLLELIKVLKKSKYTYKISFVVISLFYSSFCDSFSFDLITINAGSWIVIADRNDSLSADYFNTAGVNSYISFWELNGYIEIPFLWTVESRYDKNRNKIPSLSKNQPAFADLKFYIAKKVKFLEPRIGMIIPLAYPTDNAWIGSKNFKLQIGVGINSDIYENDFWNTSGDIMWNIYISGNKNIKGALARKGSWDLLYTFKTSIKPVEEWKFGMEILGSIKKIKWVWDNNDIYEFGFSVVPNIYCEYFISPNLFLNLKMGFGPNSKGKFGTAEKFNGKDMKHTDNSINLSFSVNIYP